MVTRRKVCVGCMLWMWLVVCGAGWVACSGGGPTQVVFSGGWPGRALGRIGTLVVRMMGSSLLVEDVVDGGGAVVLSGFGFGRGGSACGEVAVGGV